MAEKFKFKIPEKWRRVAKGARNIGLIVITGASLAAGYDVASRRLGGEGLDPLARMAGAMLPNKFAWIVMPDASRPGCVRLEIWETHKPSDGEEVGIVVRPFFSGSSDSGDASHDPRLDFSGMAMGHEEIPSICPPPGGSLQRIEMTGINGEVQASTVIFER